jgi:hypothetical protein
LEQVLYLPTGTAVQLVVSAPILVLAAEDPKGTRQSASAQSQQRSQCLFDGAFTGAGLGKGWNPSAKNREQSVE